MKKSLSWLMWLAPVLVAALYGFSLWALLFALAFFAGYWVSGRLRARFPRQ